MFALNKHRHDEHMDTWIFIYKPQLIPFPYHKSGVYTKIIRLLRGCKIWCHRNIFPADVNVDIKNIFTFLPSAVFTMTIFLFLHFICKKIQIICRKRGLISWKCDEHFCRNFLFALPNYFLTVFASPPISYYKYSLARLRGCLLQYEESKSFQSHLLYATIFQLTFLVNFMWRIL